MKTTRLGHPELIEAAALGVVAGAATGIAGGPPGIVAGGVVGALVGTIAGVAMEKASVAADARDRQLDETIGVTGPTLGARELAASGLNGSRKREAAERARHMRAELLAEHAELELLVEELQGCVAAGDCKALGEPWRKFEAELVAHFAVEERDLFPEYREYAPNDAREFERAHAEIRKRVDDLALGIELHSARAEQFEELLGLLRNHRRAEEAAFYRWVEEGAAA